MSSDPSSTSGAARTFGVGISWSSLPNKLSNQLYNTLRYESLEKVQDQQKVKITKPDTMSGKDFISKFCSNRVGKG